MCVKFFTDTIWKSETIEEGDFDDTLPVSTICSSLLANVPRWLLHLFFIAKKTRYTTSRNTAVREDKRKQPNRWSEVGMQMYNKFVTEVKQNRLEHGKKFNLELKNRLLSLKATEASNKKSRRGKVKQVTQPLDDLDDLSDDGADFGYNTEDDDQQSDEDDANDNDDDDDEISIKQEEDSDDDVMADNYVGHTRAQYFASL